MGRAGCPTHDRVRQPSCRSPETKGSRGRPRCRRSTDGRGRARLDERTDNCRSLPADRVLPQRRCRGRGGAQICAECPVKAPCLEYAIENRIDHGVWGGCSERERRRIFEATARRRGARARSPRTGGATARRCSASASSSWGRLALLDALLELLLRLAERPGQLGQLGAPNSSRTITSTMMSSVAPRFMRSVLDAVPRCRVVASCAQPSRLLARVRNQRQRGPRSRRHRRDRRGRRRRLLDVHTDPTTTAGCSAGRARTRRGRSPPRPSRRLDLARPRRRPPPHRRGGRGARSCRSTARHGRRSRRPATRSRDGPATSSALPCFLYGTERTLPEVRRRAFVTLAPDTGPPQPHPTAGAWRWAPVRCSWPTTCGWPSPTSPRPGAIAAAVRSPAVRALGLEVGDEVQVSMNLDRTRLRSGPAEATTRWPRTRRWPAPSWWAWCRPKVLAAGARGRWAELDLGCRARRSRPPRASGPPAADGRARRVSAAARGAGGRGPAGDGYGAARARSCRPRCRTSRRSRARTPGSPRGRRNPCRPPWPHAWTRHARGRRGQGRRPGSWRSPANPVASMGSFVSFMG